jgi:hypothetical protein
LQPDRLKVGAGTILVSLNGIAQDWGVQEEDILKLLGHFKIDLIKIPGGEKRYLNLWALEYCLFEAGLPEAFRGNRESTKALLESAAVAYGTATREAVRERVKKIASQIRKGRKFSKGTRSRQKKT